MQGTILNTEKPVYICLLTKNPGNRRKRFFSSAKCPDRLWGPPTLLFMGTGVKLLVCEVDRSPPSNAKIKNGCICTSARATFLHSATAFSGPGPPNRSFTITLSTPPSVGLQRPLTTHNTRKRQTYMSPEGSDPHS